MPWQDITIFQQQDRAAQSTEHVTPSRCASPSFLKEIQTYCCRVTSKPQATIMLTTFRHSKCPRQLASNQNLRHCLKIIGIFLPRPETHDAAHLIAPWLLPNNRHKVDQYVPAHRSAKFARNAALPIVTSLMFF